MKNIKKAENYPSIMFFFEPKLRYFFGLAENSGGAVFCMYEDDVPVGVVCLEKQKSNLDVSYLYTNEERRKEGLATDLIKHAAAYAEKTTLSLRFRVLEKNPYYSALLSIANKLGLSPIDEMLFFRLDINSETKKLWEDYRPKLINVIKRLDKRMGEHEVISFGEADEALLQKLRDKIGRELPGLNPYDLPDINPDFSLLLIHAGEIVAINAVRTIGKKMVYDISSAQKGMTLTAGVPAFFDKLFASDIECVTCMVRSDNHEGLNHARGRYGFLFKENGRQVVYS